ncbi:MAG: L-2-amino-thiazoline-4-carboxylic acid hydrolase [Proteobacteria bacterium]|nr:L-2-amino-thiazoline-4-carboxylic acid hydrolase [Pseudomonadota bacterium]
MRNETNEEVDEMPSQIRGYYSSRKKKLLKDFDRTSELMKDALFARYSEEFSSTLQREAHQEYEKLIPEIPYIKGVRARALNTFLLITAQELAAYKAMTKHGRPPAEAWELCHQALRLRVAKIPRWKRWLLRRLMFSSLMRKIMARRARQQQKVRFGDFEVEYLVGEGNAFDLGVNYLQCGNHRFMMQHGGEVFAPYICMSDIALSDAMEWGLIRTQTLADGCHYCDFRFKEGTATQISSKTPEVQDTIEKIRDKENEQGATADG